MNNLDLINKEKCNKLDLPSIRINVMREGRLKEVCGEQVAKNVFFWWLPLFDNNFTFTFSLIQALLAERIIVHRAKSTLLSVVGLSEKARSWCWTSCGNA